MKDTLMEPWQRVAVREIEDFSVKLTLASNNEVFWKWYSVANDEVERIITEKFRSAPAVVPEPIKASEIIEPVKEVEVKTNEIKLSEFDKPVEVIKEKKVRAKKKEVSVEALHGKEPVEDETFSVIRKWFAENNAEMVEETIVRKKKDLEGVVAVKSSLGNVHMFMKFKDKKKVNDAELSLAQSRARTKNLSLIFLSTGELSKKAEAYAEKNHIMCRKIAI
jgi:hypothetical protein